MVFAKDGRGDGGVIPPGLGVACDGHGKFVAVSLNAQIPVQPEADSKGTVTLRLDHEKAFSKEWHVSEDSKILMDFDAATARGR